MKECELKFKASLGDKVRHKMTGFTGAVTMVGIGESGVNQYFVERHEGPGQWITEPNLEEAPPEAAR